MIILPVPTPTRLFANPNSKASLLRMTRPVRIISIALEYPISLGSRTVPPHIMGIPNLLFKKPKTAVSSTILKSHIKASSSPTPIANPSTAAISGFAGRLSLLL